MLARALAAAVVLGAIFVGCKGELNVNYCAAHPNDDDCRNLGLVEFDAPAPQCMTNPDCAGRLEIDPNHTVCDTSTGTCVQCLDVVAEGPCMAIGQFCGPDRACHGCIVDNHCAATSGVCLASQSCALESAVVFVSRTGSGDTCTKAAPCSLQTGVMKLSATRNILKIAPDETAYTGAPISFMVNADVQVLANGATFEPSTAGTAVTVLSHVVIVGLTVKNAMDGDGISCTNGSLTLRDVRVEGTTGTWPNSGWGLHTAACELVVERSRFTGNVGGGMKVSGARMDIRNNIIDRNGSLDVEQGNVMIRSATGTFRFNTVVLNLSRSGSRIGGLTCTQNVQSFVFARNIIASNGAANAEYDPNGNCEGNAVVNHISNDLQDIAFADTNEFFLTAATKPGDILNDPLSAMDCLVTGTTKYIDDFEGKPRPEMFCDRGAREFRGQP